MHRIEKDADGPHKKFEKMGGVNLRRASGQTLHGTFAEKELDSYNHQGAGTIQCRTYEHTKCMRVCVCVGGRE